MDGAHFNKNRMINVGISLVSNFQSIAFLIEFNCSGVLSAKQSGLGAACLCDALIYSTPNWLDFSSPDLMLGVDILIFWILSESVYCILVLVPEYGCPRPVLFFSKKLFEIWMNWTGRLGLGVESYIGFLSDINMLFLRING